MQMPPGVVDNSLEKAILSEPSGSSLEVVLQGGQIVSWKNRGGEELLFVRSKNDSSKPAVGGVSICFPQVSIIEQHPDYGSGRQRVWSFEKNNHSPSSSSSSSFNLIFNNICDSKIDPYRFELRLNITLGPGKLNLTPSVTNIGQKSFSFTFAIRNCFSLSDISEVRIEGLETLDYLDNLQNGRRCTEQVDALTFDSEVNRTYLNTPSKIAIIDHGRKRTFVVTKQGLPDAVVCNPWNRSGKSLAYLVQGEEYKNMVWMDSAAIEKPVVLKPFEVWTAFQEIATVSSSYCSGNLDPSIVLQYTT